jgi:chemotaxis response regulator CheB
VQNVRKNIFFYIQIFLASNAMMSNMDKLHVLENVMAQNIMNIIMYYAMKKDAKKDFII